MPILKCGGQIFRAEKRFVWPEDVSVVVSVVHVCKQLQVQDACLNGRAVPRISAFLIAGEADRAPFKLKESPYFAKGSQIYGQGFVFDLRRFQGLSVSVEG